MGLTKCMLCMRLFRGDGFYCSHLCEQRCKPTSASLGDNASPNKELDAVGAGEVAKALGVPLAAVTNACKSGKLRGWQRHTRWWVARADVERLVQELQEYGKVDL